MITNLNSSFNLTLKSNAKLASILALAAAGVFFLLLTVVFTNGISQQYFELVHTPEIYTAQIKEHSGALNIIFILDNIFIILYTSMALFTINTFSDNAPVFISRLAVTLICIVALLDYLENFHIYSLMQLANDGYAVNLSDIKWQSVESMMKWHLAYFAFFILGFLIPAANPVEKLLKYSLWFLFLPAGVMVYAAVETKYESLFQWLRFINLLSGFILIGIIMRKYSKQQMQN